MSWYDTDWDYRVEITVDNTQVDGDLSDFAVYVDLSDMPESFFTNVDSAGADIRITRADGTTECAFEIVAIDTSAKTGELHFKANFLSSSSDTSFKIYYGNAGASAYAATDTYGSENVWTDNVIGAWHHEETSGNIVDSSSNGISLTRTGPTSVEGALSGNGSDFDGTNDYFNSGTDVSVLNNLTGDFTFSFWLKRNNSSTLSSAEFIFSKRNSAGGDKQQWSMMLDNGSSGSNAELVFNCYSGGWRNVPLGPTITDTNWHHIVLKHDDTSTLECYKDGVSSGTVGYTHGITSFTNSMFKGRDGANGNPRYADIKLDEFRVFDALLSDDYIVTDYNNQNSPSTFYTVGSEEAQPTADTFTAKTSIF